MSTITSIAIRPSSAPKTPIYPRLLRLTTCPSVIIWALSPSSFNPNSFNGVVICAGESKSHKVGNYGTDWNIGAWEDFNDAVTLYNK